MIVPEPLTPAQIDAAELVAWRVVDGMLAARWRTGSFAVGIRLIDLIGPVADEMNHHPDVDLRYPHVDVRLVTHDAGGITELDVTLARRIDDLAAGLGVEPTA